MDNVTADMLRYAVAAPLGLYTRADTIVRLLTNENVSEVMGRLPPPMMEEFVRFAREAYVARGPRFAVTGSVVPEPCLEALRAWLAASVRLRTLRPLKSNSRPSVSFPAGTEIAVLGPLDDARSFWLVEVRTPSAVVVGGVSYDFAKANLADLGPELEVSLVDEAESAKGEPTEDLVAAQRAPKDNPVVLKKGTMTPPRETAQPQLAAV